MGVKAIDIAILPPEEILDLAIGLSKKIDGPGKIQLNKTDQLPHITLLFGGIEDSNIEFLWKKTEEILERFEPLELVIEKPHLGKSTGLDIGKTEKLAELHSILVDEIAPLLSYPVDTKNFRNSHNVQEVSLGFVNNYLESASKEKFIPHITLGDGGLAGKYLPRLPIKFTANRIALCHLGNLCTCAEILSEKKL